jgi:carbonic anhydrase/acetyltransferase-like protein (isoleucine patch superfamily)
VPGFVKRGTGAVLYQLGDDKPVVGKGAFVAPDASAIGKVRLGERASLWFHAVARGDNEWIEIGRHSNVQDLSMLHTDIGSPLTIGEYVTVGHRVILHGCTLADYSLIGMGSIVMNGAKVGCNAIVGAGSLIGEGKEIPEGVLAFGSPVRVVRDLKAEEIALIKQSAEHYADKAALFLARLGPGFSA